jgi:hypothetical protein
VLFFEEYKSLRWCNELLTPGEAPTVSTKRASPNDEKEVVPFISRSLSMPFFS